MRLRMLSALVCLGAVSTSAYAQMRALNDEVVFASESVANLFIESESQRPIDGAFLQLPLEWKLLQVRLIQSGRQRAVSWSDEDVGAGGDAYTLRFEDLDPDPHRLIVQLRAPAGDSKVDMTLIPWIGESPGTPRTHLTPMQVELASEERPLDTDNLVAAFDTRSVLELDPDALPMTSTDRSFTLEFWLKTVELNQVVMSAWNGEEEEPYSAEIVIAPDGRLLFFRGEPGRHVAMTSSDPVADGTWRHVAISYDELQGNSRLLVDGTPVDSLFSVRLSAQPSDPRFCVGGRCDTARPSALGGYSGNLDDVRIWPSVRTHGDILASMVEPPSAAPGLIALKFEDSPASEYLLGNDVVSREPSDFLYFDPIEDLAVTHQVGRVEVRWRSGGRSTTLFVVERSLEGILFDELARYEPDESVSGRFTHYDESAERGVAYYRVRQVLENEGVRYSAVMKVGLGGFELPDAEAGVLLGNFPNPFSAATTISFEVTEPQHVNVSIWDISGQQIASLLDASVATGRHEVVFVPGDLPSGTYFARLQTDAAVSTRKIILTK